MKSFGSPSTQHVASQIPPELWKPELDSASRRYHLIACWAAIIFDPIFAVTDYINIPDSWSVLLVIRLCVSATILLTLVFKDRLGLSTHALVSVPFLLISIQNAFTYSLVGPEDLLGHNLNYIALLIGASMFVLWRWSYSVIIVVISAMATAWFLTNNPSVTVNAFLLNGGLILVAVAIFMITLIQTRYNLNVREIKARLALKLSNEEINAQAEEIKAINENLEALVVLRTVELEKKNKALEEYAYINAHKLRSPVASILGLINLLEKIHLTEEPRKMVGLMRDAAANLDRVVGSITQAIEKGDSEG